MSISAVTPRPSSSSAVRRWLIVAAAMTLAGLIAAVVVLSRSSPMPDPGSASARPGPVQGEYFRDPATHVLLPLRAQVIPPRDTTGAVSHPRP